MGKQQKKIERRKVRKNGKCKKGGKIKKRK